VQRPSLERAGLIPALAVFTGLFVLPVGALFVVSFWTVRARMMRPDFTLANYAETFRDHSGMLLTTLGMAAMVAVLTTLLAFGFAYAARFRAGRWADLMIFLTLITLFGGYLVKIYAWKSILGRDGILNGALMGLGLVDEPVQALIYSQGAVVLTLTYFLLPFAILPIYGALRSIPDSHLAAARDLGAGPWRAVRDVVLPQVERGVAVAFTLSFLIAAGDYVTPRFVGGGASLMGHVIETKFSVGFNWPLGAAMSFTLMGSALLVCVAARLAYRRAVRP
jgi:spermidine/putrescine transport system permease protein